MFEIETKGKYNDKVRKENMNNFGRQMQEKYLYPSANIYQALIIL